MAPRDKGERTRQRIVEAATPLFLERGYGATSLADILAATGTTKGGFYFHFASKLELALAVLDDVRTLQRDAIMTSAGVYQRAVKQLAAIIRAAAAQKRAQPQLSALGRLCQELAHEPGALEEVRPFAAWIELTEGLLRLAQAQGDMDPDIDAAAAAHFGVAAYVGTDQLADLNGTDISADDADDLVDFVFRAVGIRIGRPELVGR